MTPLWSFVALLIVHWSADFVLQSRWMGRNKSSRLDALAAHVAVYTMALAVGAALIFRIDVENRWTLLAFVLTNGIAHFATDFVSSRITSALWKAKREYAFFTAIGFDQLVHQATLAATMWWFL